MSTWLNRIALIVVFATIPSFASAQTARESDSLLNGALIGAGAGIASELVLCRMMEPWDVCVAPGPMVTFGAVGGRYRHRHRRADSIPSCRRRRRHTGATLRCTRHRPRPARSSDVVQVLKQMSAARSACIVVTMPRYRQIPLMVLGACGSRQAAR